MVVCHLPDYLGFIHLVRELSLAAGQILLVSKMDVGEKVWIVIAIKQREEVRPVLLKQSSIFPASGGQ